MQNHPQKGSATIVIFIILLLTLGGTVAYFKNFPLKKLPVEQVKLATINDTPVSGRGGEQDTSSWKTYRDEKCGFEMKYPPDRKIKSTRILISIEAENVLQTQEAIWIFCGEQVPQVLRKADNFEQMKAATDIFYRELARQEKEEISSYIKKDIMVNRYKAVAIKNTAYEGANTEITVFVDKNNIFQIFRHPKYNQDFGADEFFKENDAIIETFTIVGTFDRQI